MSYKQTYQLIDRGFLESFGPQGIAYELYNRSIKFANFSYFDVMNMPTFERRYFIDKLIEENTPKNE